MEGEAISYSTPQLKDFSASESCVVSLESH